MQEGEQIHGLLKNRPNEKNKRDLDITISYSLDASDEGRMAEGSCFYEM